MAVIVQSVALARMSAGGVHVTVCVPSDALAPMSCTPSMVYVCPAIVAVNTSFANTPAATFCPPLIVYVMSTLLFQGQRCRTLSMVMLAAFAAIALAATAAKVIILLMLILFSFRVCENMKAEGRPSTAAETNTIREDARPPGAVRAKARHIRF